MNNKNYLTKYLTLIYNFISYKIIQLQKKKREREGKRLEYQGPIVI